MAQEEAGDVFGSYPTNSLEIRIRRLRRLRRLRRSAGVRARVRRLPRLRRSAGVGAGIRRLRRFSKWLQLLTIGHGGQDRHPLRESEEQRGKETRVHPGLSMPDA
ncbi:MAG: hypothetical protein EBZ36_03065 [Acidobacteria bacterium]|nr:hypothetical protein [Acidobacteriota bacterium]